MLENNKIKNAVGRGRGKVETKIKKKYNSRCCLAASEVQATYVQIRGN